MRCIGKFVIISWHTRQSGSKLTIKAVCMKLSSCIFSDEDFCLDAMVAQVIKYSEFHEPCQSFVSFWGR